MTERVLITGGAGFIGSFLADQFLRQGDEVVALDLLDQQVHPNGRPDYLSNEIELRVGDVRDRSALDDALKGATIVVHCAAAVGVGQSLYRVQHYIDTNVGGTAALLGSLIERRQTPRKLIVFTSMTSYGEGLYRRPSTGELVRPPVRSEEQIQRWGWDIVDPASGEVLQAVPTPEDAALLARNVYALSKRYQEELALSLGELYGFPTTCLRLFNVYGPRHSLSNPYTGVLAIFLSRLLSGEAPVIYEDGCQSRDFISVHDIVRAAMLAINTPASAGHVFNIGTGIARPIGELARTLAQLVGRETIEPKITRQFRKGDIRHCTADLSRSRSVLGFVPQADWEQSLLEVARWSDTAPKADRFGHADQELRAYGLVQ